MAEIFNLRRARKAKAKGEKDKAAAANRLTHGTPKTLRKLETARKEQAAERFGGHKLDNETDDN